MLVRSLIEREGGTHVTMGGRLDAQQAKTPVRGRQYHFAPNDYGHHTCEVTNQADLTRFLGVTQGGGVPAFVPYDVSDPDAWKRDWEAAQAEEEKEAADWGKNGQPPVTSDFVDDDDDDDDDLSLDGEDEPDYGNAPPLTPAISESGEVMVADDPSPDAKDILSCMPDQDAEDDAWLAWGGAIVESPEDQEALIQYGASHYGLDLNRRMKPATLLKKIGEAMNADD